MLDLANGETTYFLLDSDSKQNPTAMNYGDKAFSSEFPESILLIDVVKPELADIWTKPSHFVIDMNNWEEMISQTKSGFDAGFSSGAVLKIGGADEPGKLKSWVFPNPEESEIK